MRYFIQLSYNGSNYCGWQIQPNGPSIQAELNKALSTLLRAEIYVVGAGRTDTGFMAAVAERAVTDLAEMSTMPGWPAASLSAWSRTSAY